MFKQIIGRGTRLRYDEGKRSFVIMDFRGVTRLFADPDWDGPLIEDPGFESGKGEGKPTGRGGKGGGGGGEPAVKPFVRADGCKVYTVQETIAVYDTDGKLLKQENVIDYTKENILEQFGDLHRFIHEWNAAEKKQAIADALAKRGVDLDKLKHAMKMDDVDDFDFICHVAYDQKPLTRRERAEGVRRRDFLSRYSGAARAVLETLLESYKDLGIKNIEKADVLRMKDFQKFGTPGRIGKLFNGKKGYEEAVRALEQELYKAG